MWKQERAGSGAWQVVRLADSEILPSLVENLTPHAQALLDDGKLHSEADVMVAVQELKPNTAEVIDAFVIVASEAARHRADKYGLLAFVSIREWAEKNRAPVLVIDS